MKKADKIRKEISLLEMELKGCKELLTKVKGNAVGICPKCKTNNYHWTTEDVWYCTFCGHIEKNKE